ncbi:MAG: hypothetical protein K2Y29_04910 [Beijerinckiaceae bacterium]|nr:hypothetical protein [Beijerinckiaceae bacterium]
MMLAAVFISTSPEAALRALRNKLRLAQVFVALLAMLVSAVPDLRGVAGYRSGEIALLEPLEKQEARESVAPQTRAIEDVEEFLGHDAPGARSAGFDLALSDGAHLRRCAQSWTPSRRHSCAHPPTGPPIG